MTDKQPQCGKELKDVFTAATTLLTQAAFTASAEKRVELVSKARDKLYDAIAKDRIQARKNAALRQHGKYIDRLLERYKDENEGEGI